MSVNRLLANLAQSLDSSSVGSFLSGDSADRFQTLQWTDVSGRPTIADSATATSIIDSAYVQSRVTTYAVGLDSATTIALLDSDYISSKVTNDVGFFIYHYDTTAGQTLLDSSNEASNNAISYTKDYVMVFKNGVLLDSASGDYTAISGNTVVLGAGADSGELVTVVKWAPGSSSSGSASTSWMGDRGVIAGGNSTSIEYIAVATPSNASSFGDLTTSRGNLGGSGISDATYGLCQVGGATNTIEYITFSTIGDASSFGNLTASPLRNTCVSDGTYGLSGAGYASAAYLNTIDYVTIASPGNATDFGDLTRTADNPASGNDATYGLWGGGYNGGIVNTIDYVTMASPGNATDFGDLTQARFNCSGSHDDTYVVFAGGNGNKSTIDYVTTATPGNATSFGSLTSGKQYMAGGIADGTYGVFAGGLSINVIEYITIASPSNGTDFGDLLANRSNIMGTAGNS